MKTIFFAALATGLFFLCPYTMAQSGSGKISGLITVGKKPADGATISLFRAKDNTLVKGAITNETGKFEIDNLRPDTFLVGVSYLGRGNYLTTPITLSDANSIVELPVIDLGGGNNPVNLKEVGVTAQKPFIERKIDRVVINPDVLISNAGSNALEVLEKAPGVQVDGNVISLKGKQGVVVFIDDKPTYMSTQELANYLRSLPSGSIDIVEIMTNPPAKYDAAGNAGVINIRMKKIKVKGFNGSFSTTYGQGRYARSLNSLTLNYRLNKVNFFGVGSFNMTNDYQDLNIKRTYFKTDGNVDGAFVQESYIKNRRKSGNVRMGMDYYISKKSTFGIVLNGVSNPSDSRSRSLADMLNAGEVTDSVITSSNRQDEKWRSGSINLNYSYKFDSTGKEITANTDYIAYRSTSNQLLQTNVSLPDHTLFSSAALLSTSPTDIDIRTAMLDYKNPFKKGGSWEAGFKASFINTDNKADFFDQHNGENTVNYDLTNYFKYNEKIKAAYISFNKDFRRLSVQAGLRFENTEIKGHQLGNPEKPDSLFTRKYNSLFPTFYLSYKLDTTNTNELGFTYGRRIKRPNYQDLNPFLYPLDKYTSFAGNTFLQPAFSQNFELSHSYKNRITTTLQYSRIKDVIQETIEVNNGYFTSRPGNIGTQRNFGITVSTNFKITGWWTVQQLYTELINNKFSGLLYNNQLNTDATYWMLNMNNQFTINKLWSAEIAGFYRTDMASGQFLTDRLWTMRVAVQKKLFKGNGNIKVLFNDIFYAFQPQGRIVNLTNTSSTYHNYLDSRLLMITFSYRFNKGATLKARQSGASDTEKSRVSGG
ncbi:TonB-dependent receptor [Chitinophaga oryziterrae]|uniref:TonB-dependent receptor n=1 Tax=Chitinophaga oryziterrae TaxID=1031224 RepID=A0A6N8JET5_9BACT|nr:TonB-dependent receptor [Chitinophaga oryziterrae]MVT42876.1 TonB-dependent receptor [Chitinophaga oryziterrae]